LPVGDAECRAHIQELVRASLAAGEIHGHDLTERRVSKETAREAVDQGREARDRRSEEGATRFEDAAGFPERPQTVRPVGNFKLGRLLPAAIEINEGHGQTEAVNCSLTFFRAEW